MNRIGGEDRVGGGGGGGVQGRGRQEEEECCGCFRIQFLSASTTCC